MFSLGIQNANIYHLALVIQDDTAIKDWSLGTKMIWICFEDAKETSVIL